MKKVKLSFLVLTSLITLSFAFFVAAKSDSTTSTNTLLDSDRDGLTDQEEKTYGTNPHNTDTDGDSYSDGAEVKSGYDPLKPAPGDKIVREIKTTTSKNDSNNEGNLTNQIAQKISDITLNPSSDNQDITLSSVTDIVDSALSQNNDNIALPEITRDQIKIKKQNYSGLSAKKVKERKREDFTNYIAAMYYVLSSNSPEPITSGSDMTKIFSSLTSQITQAISSRNASSLSDINKSGEKMMEQIKAIEVPEDLVDIHIKALQFAQYSKNVQGYLNPNSEDPMADIANLSKLEGLITNLMSFSEEAQTKFNEYGLTYDELSSKVKTFGVTLPTDQIIVSNDSDTAANTESDSSE